MKKWENRVQVRPAPNQNFNMDFAPCAMTRGAPVLSKEINLPNTKNIKMYPGFVVDEAISFIKEVHAAKGILCFLWSILTHPRILHELAEGNSLGAVDKFSPTIRLADQYNRILCCVPRHKFPGNRIPNLVRRDGQNDYGLPDVTRVVGQDFGKSAPFRENETRPLMHKKTLVGLVPQGKKFVAQMAFRGSANGTAHAENSWEDVERVDDPDYAKVLYDSFAHTYSMSEGLFAYAPGPMPTYEWRKRPPKTVAVPPCPACSSHEIGLMWQAQKGEALCRRLCCTSCGEVFGKPLLYANWPLK